MTSFSVCIKENDCMVFVAADNSIWNKYSFESGYFNYVNTLKEITLFSLFHCLFQNSFVSWVCITYWYPFDLFVQCEDNGPGNGPESDPKSGPALALLAPRGSLSSSRSDISSLELFAVSVKHYLFVWLSVLFSL